MTLYPEALGPVAILILAKTCVQPEYKKELKDILTYSISSCIQYTCNARAIASAILTTLFMHQNAVDMKVIYRDVNIVA